MSSSSPDVMPPYRLRHRLAIPAFAAATLLAACGGSSADSQSAQATSAPTTAATTTSADATSATTTAEGSATTTAASAGSDSAAAETREVLLSLPTEALGGVTFDNTAYVGEDVLLWFWAPW